MGKISRAFGLIVFAIAIGGCASGHCRGRKSGDGGFHVFVYKPDNSKQCEKQSGVSAQDMAAQLKDIQIYSKENKPDGNMHITLCGAATGKINVYEIPLKDLDKAKELGFAEWKSEN